MDFPENSCRGIESGAKAWSELREGLAEGTMGGNQMGCLFGVEKGRPSAYL
jgi:hypothetical protein